MNELSILKFKDREIRVVTIELDPWWVAKDVCEALEISNTTDALKRLDDDEVTRFNLGGLSGEVNIVNEAGLYSLILGSRKSEAKLFKRWITHEVLPGIRKHGMYAKDELLDNPDLLLDVITKLKDERAKRQALESKMVALETTNEILVTEQLHWADSKMINAIIRRVGKSVGYESAWRDFKKEMLYKHGININARQEGYFKQNGKKPKSTLDVLDKEELSLAVKVSLAICSVNKCNVDDLLRKIAIA